MKKLKSVAMYCIGIFIVSMGVVLAIKTELGVSPVSSLPYVVSQITGVDIGICTTGVMSFFIIVQMIMLGRKFKMISWLQVISASIFGFCVSCISYMMSFVEIPDNYGIRLLCCLFSMMILAIGIHIYLKPNFFILPAEGTMQVISQRFDIPLHRAKIIFDSTVVGCSILLSYLFLGKLEGVREGTVLAAFGVGFCLKFVRKISAKIEKRYVK